MRTKPMTEQEIIMNYTVEQSRFNLFTSYTPEGEDMVTAATEEECRFATENIHIPSMYGTFRGYTSVGGKASVGVDL